MRMQFLNVAYQAVLAIVRLSTQTTREGLDTHVTHGVTQQIGPPCETPVAVVTFVGAMRCSRVLIQFTKTPKFLQFT